jgi:hypothetical protein
MTALADAESGSGRGRDMDPRLIRLRVELFTAAQELTGEDADEFWKLIGELRSFQTNLRWLRAAPPAPAPERVPDA